MTVPPLRAECKRLGLPTYQLNGKRIGLYELCKQLFLAGRITYDKSWPYTKRWSNVGERTSLEGFIE